MNTHMRTNNKNVLCSPEPAVACTLPVVVVLVDDGDGAGVQVDPQEVRPHFDAALQLVGVLQPSQLAVDGVDAQRSRCSQRGHCCVIKTVYQVT